MVKGWRSPLRRETAILSVPDIVADHTGMAAMAELQTTTVITAIFRFSA